MCISYAVFCLKKKTSRKPALSCLEDEGGGSRLQNRPGARLARSRTWRAIGASSCTAFSKWASLSFRLAEPPCVPSRRSSKWRIRLVMYAGIVLCDITLPPTNNQYLRGACTTYRSRRGHLLPSLVSAAALDEDHAGRRTCAALRNTLFLGGPSYSSPPPVR